MRWSPRSARHTLALLAALALVAAVVVAAVPAGAAAQIVQKPPGPPGPGEGAVDSDCPWYLSEDERAETEGCGGKAPKPAEDENDTEKRRPAKPADDEQDAEAPGPPGPAEPPPSGDGYEGCEWYLTQEEKAKTKACHTRPVDRSQAGGCPWDLSEKEMAKTKACREMGLPKPDADEPGGDGGGDKSKAGDGGLADIFGPSPFCKGVTLSSLDGKTNLKAHGRAAAYCRRSGSIAQAYPTASYGLDVWLDDPTDLTASAEDSIGDIVPNAVQSVISILWVAVFYGWKMAQLLWELGFSNDLIDTAMSTIGASIERVDKVFGTTAWRTAAMSILGFWGLWTGLVRMRTIQTFAGLAIAVGLMMATQVVIARPDDTVGRLGRLANDVALAAISIASKASLDNPADAFADADQTLFKSVIVRPWCALQFTNVEGCLEEQEGPPKASIADAWLSFPAGSKQRKWLYEHQDGKPAEMKLDSDTCTDNWLVNNMNDTLARDGAIGVCGWFADDKNEGKFALDYKNTGKGRVDTKLQTTDGAYTRAAIMVLVVIGIVSATFTLGWLGARMLLASVYGTVLLLLLPVVFIMAAFGEPGRRAAVAYFQRLFGTVIAKAVYAFYGGFLAVGCETIQAIPIGWGGKWAATAALFLGAYNKRNEAIGWLTAEKKATEPGLGLAGSGGGGRGRGFGLLSLFAAWRLGRAAADRTVGASYRAGRRQMGRAQVVAGDRNAHRQAQRDEAAAHARADDTDHRGAESTAIREHDHEAMGGELRAARGAEHAAEVSRARDLVNSRSRAETELAANQARQAQIAARLGGPRPPSGDRYRRLRDEQHALQGREALLNRKLDAWTNDPTKAAEMRAAERTFANRRGFSPRDPSGREVDEWMTRRRSEIASLPATDPANLVAAGINPETYRRANDVAQRDMARRSQEAMDRQSALIGTATSQGAMSREELNAHWDRIGGNPFSATAGRARDELGSQRRTDADRQARRAVEDTARQVERAAQRRADRVRQQQIARRRGLR